LNEKLKLKLKIEKLEVSNGELIKVVKRLEVVVAEFEKNKPKQINNSSLDIAAKTFAQAVIKADEDVVAALSKTGSGVGQQSMF